MSERKCVHFDNRELMVNIAIISKENTKIFQIEYWRFKITCIFFCIYILYIVQLYSLSLALFKIIIIFAYKHQNKKSRNPKTFDFFVRSCWWQWFKIFNESVRIIIIENAYKYFICKSSVYVLSVHILNGIFNVFMHYNVQDVVS